MIQGTGRQHWTCCTCSRVRAHCEALSDLTIGNSVTTIGANAFGSCLSLESVVIPDSVITIESAFNRHVVPHKRENKQSGIIKKRSNTQIETVLSSFAGCDHGQEYGSNTKTHRQLTNIISSPVSALAMIAPNCIPAVRIPQADERSDKGIQ